MDAPQFQHELMTVSRFLDEDRREANLEGIFGCSAYSLPDDLDKTARRVERCES